MTAACVAIAAEGLALAASPPGSARWNEAAVALVIMAYAAVGVLILWHRPGHRIGQVAVGLAAVWGTGQALLAFSHSTLVHDPHATTAALASVAGGFLRGLPWMVAVLVLPLIFPDGKQLDTRLARAAARVTVLVLVTFTLVSLFSPTLTDSSLDDVPNPLGLPGVLGVAMGPLSGLMILGGVAGIGLAVAVVMQRYRRTGALGRQQTLVFAVAFVPPVAGFVASLAGSAEPWLFGLTSLPVPIAIGIAVLQRRLYDLPLVVNASLTYGMLWLLIAVFYAVIVGGVGATLQRRDAVWLPWLAAGVVAVSFAPLRESLQRMANRITYGQWAQPGEVLARTSARLSDAGNLPALLASLADDLAVGLSLGFVEITNREGHILAVAGAVTDDTDAWPLTVYGAQVGMLRWRRRPLRERDRELLGRVAAQLGTVVHADGLLTSVRVAQERLVLAREEERRRLRRDLHDGIGPALAGLILQVDTVRNRFDNDEADGALLMLRSGIQETVGEVRRIVEGLRPPALDDLGLVEAVHQLAERLPGPSVEVVADLLSPLPAAVEVAAYRIVQEGLSNASRHAQAQRVRVDLAVRGGDLVVTIADDGTGAVVPRPHGVGLGSMRERAEEVGGRFDLRADPGLGTTVTATLPLEVRP